ncbi:DNA cytosine methyltransferase [Micromonospora sp. C51]|uniref:DNA cytosine methyltransferase n=1 Tax=Micromonospora sp. C51 TaxID=2824879 RepID=UPI001FFD0511|nr:DNA cytosine methyltransferase [Micromonospora sp. C51]
MVRPRLLDLFCGEGGASIGYYRAGFEVVGVDIKRQPRYPLEFHHADALTFLAVHWSEFDAIAASPTCQTRTRVTAWRGRREDHPDLLTPTLRALDQLPLPYVVENVPEAATDGSMRPDLLLCGTQFGLRVRRHRVFQAGNWSGFELLPPCQCQGREDLVAFTHVDELKFADAMGCVWMSARGGRQAIPPAYTEHIGRQLLAAVRHG